MSKNQDVPGNVGETTRLAQERSLRLARELEMLSAYYSEDGGGAFSLVSLRFRAPNPENGEWLAIATIIQEGVQYVGFSSGLTLADSFQLLGRRIRKGTMKWREDEYANRG